MALAAEPAVAGEEPTPATTPDALEFLRDAYARLLALFEDYRAPRADKPELARRLIRELRIVAAVEQAILFPALRDAATGRERALETLAEAERDRETLDLLLTGVGERIAGAAGAPSPDLDAGIEALRAAAARRMKTAGETLFPLLRRSGLDLAELGLRLKAHKSELAAAAPSAG